MFMNILGLIPFSATATGNINVTATLATVSFIMMQAAGIQKYGLIQYIKNIVPSGVPFWIYPILFPVELLGMLTKSFALAIRLFANMIAGHIVITVLISLIIVFKFPGIILFPAGYFNTRSIYCAFTGIYLYVSYGCVCEHGTPRSLIYIRMKLN